MNSKKQFSYPWHQFQNRTLNEDFTSTMRGAVGQLSDKAKKASEMSPACNPAALKSPELEPDPETLQAVDEKGMAFYVNQLACQMIDGDVSGVTEYFKDVGSKGNLVQLLQLATGFIKEKAKEFFTLSTAQEAPGPPTPTPIAAPAPVSENVPNPEFRRKVANAAAAKDADSEAPPPVPREVAEKYIVQQLQNLFNNIDLLHFKFILGNAIITYWRTLVEDDIMDLAGNQALAANARMIAEIEIEWLTQMLQRIKSEVKPKQKLEPSSYDVDVLKAPDAKKGQSPEEIAAQEKAAWVKKRADMLNRAKNPDQRIGRSKRSPGNNRLTEQNQRWKYLAGIK